MRLESYAQQMEDMILFAALRDVPRGFYIDIGANDPVSNNVTRFFYDRGWNGINVEPQPTLCRLLEEARPRDINLCIGCGRERGRLPLLGNGELATFSDEIADKGGFGQRKAADLTEILTLTDIHEQYCKPAQPIHFCKIDVEGFEKDVLAGIEDWETFRPWIYVMESTLPCTSVPCHDQWEHMLLNRGYVFACVAGVNRYYVDRRKAHLMDHFSTIQSFLSQHEIVVMRMHEPIFSFHAL